MQVVVSDSSAIIDLQKGGLLEVFLELDYEFAIADVLLESELLRLSKKERRMLRSRMEVVVLSGREVERAMVIQASCRALSPHDAFSLAIAERHGAAILLTGDKRMRAKAEDLGILYHGVLWVVEALADAKLVTKRELIKVLEYWSEEPLVRLPEEEVEKLIAKLRS